MTIVDDAMRAYQLVLERQRMLDDAKARLIEYTDRLDRIDKLKFDDRAGALLARMRADRHDYLLHFKTKVK